MVISKDWLTGFIEGEGNFNVALNKKFKTKSWEYTFEYYPILQFRIFLREDDLAILEKIKDTFKIGKIYKKNCEYSRRKGINSKDQYVYYITSSKELLLLKDLLSSCEFHTKKKKDMEDFFSILELKISKKHLTREGYNKIINLAKNLNSKNREKFKVKPVTE